jgi:hypothetical protein
MIIPEDRPTRVFLVHAAIYAAVVLALAALNLWRAPDRLWVIWVALGWGIGLAAHGLGLYLRTAHRRTRIFIDPKARRFTVHAFAYVAVMLLLLFVNVTRTPERWWWYWVALGWGAGLAFHAWCAFFKKHPRAEHAEAHGRPRQRSSGGRKRS